MTLKSQKINEESNFCFVLAKSGSFVIIFQNLIIKLIGEIFVPKNLKKIL
jgi:hypothetical protein